MTTTARVECRWERAETLGVGLQGIEMDNTSARWVYDLPPACWNESFTLTFVTPRDFDRKPDRAHVIYRTGLFGFFFLRVFEA